MAEEEDAFGSGTFDDFLATGIRPGKTVSGGGRLRYQLGGKARDWSWYGNQKFLSRDWHMQCGASRWSGAAANSGNIEVFFPTPFAEPPLVMMCPAGTFIPFQEIRAMVTIQSAAAIEIYWWSTINLTKVYFNWLALGPIGL